MIASDSELLMRFTRHQDEGAFEQLVQKHASLVLGTCRQVLRNEQDVEDAFQATFLILLRRYHTIRKKNSVASWLYGVAYRTAMRAAKSKRNHAEQPLLEDPVMDSDPFDVIRDRELCNTLSEELSRLPDRYQDVLVLCYLEGKSQSQVAEELDCTEPAVKARLARGRRLLRMRMIRRGLALSTAVAAANTAISAASASTTSLTQQAVASCLSYAASGHVAGSCTTHAVTLSEQGVKAMTVSSFAKPTLAAIGVAVATLFCTFGLHNGITAATPGGDVTGEDVISIVTETDTAQGKLGPLLVGQSDIESNADDGLFFNLDGPNRRLNLTGSSTRVLTLQHRFKRVHVDNPQVISATPLSGNTLQVAGLRPGITRLSIVDERDDIHTIAIVVQADAEQQQVPDLKHKRFFEYLASGTKVELGTEKNGNEGQVLVVDEAFAEKRRLESEAYRKGVAVFSKSMDEYNEKYREFLKKHHPEELAYFEQTRSYHHKDAPLPSAPELSSFLKKFDRDWTIIYEVVGTGEDFIELKPAVISGAIDDIIPAFDNSGKNRWAKAERLILPTASIKSIRIAPPTTAP